MKKYCRLLPEEIVLLIFDFLGYPYPERIGLATRCKHYYRRQCISLNEMATYCFDRYSAAIFIFSICVGFVVGEALSHI